MKQLDTDRTTTTTNTPTPTTTTRSSSVGEDEMSADYLLLHTALKAGEEQRRRQNTAVTT